MMKSRNLSKLIAVDSDGLGADFQVVAMTGSSQDEAGIG
jgi:hypothetical protein